MSAARWGDSSEEDEEDASPGIVPLWPQRWIHTDASQGNARADSTRTNVVVPSSSSMLWDDDRRIMTRNGRRSIL
jgi:hypothetical protein